MNNEKYALKGGYGFKYKSVFYGVSGLYKGTVRSKITDPRLSVFNSWVTLNLGLAFTQKHNLFSLSICPELNVQTISSQMYSDKSLKFQQFYGFGAWNRKESIGGKTYNANYNIKGITTNLGFINDFYKLKPTFNLSFNYRLMNLDGIRT